MLGLLTLTLAVTCSLSLPTKTIRSRTGYIETRPGNIPIILAAPHGGYLRPDEIRTRRSAGCLVGGICVYSHDCEDEDTANCRAVTGADVNTIDLTEAIEEELVRLYGGQPYVVLNLLHRSKLDANRDIDEATFGDPISEEAWREFQGSIDQAKVNISGRGMFYDIHGHGHPNPWAELGYLFSGLDLDLDDINPDDSSIRSIANHVSGRGTTFETILRGPTSFGDCLNDLGWMAVPSPDDPSPLGESYFSGGYNTRRHGSRDGGQIDGIQIESARVMRELPLMPQYGIDIATCIKRFMDTHYN